MPLAPGAVLGHYEIVALIGKGGMGEVYKARDTRLGRAVAIKVIAPALADRADVQRRFEQECRLTATLDHPRICAVHDVGQQDGLLYLVMEFLEGESLAVKTARGPLPKAEVLGYAIEIAAAVHHAHRRGVIHRDLKPGNVFITPTGVKVLDFGLAKLRHTDAPPILEDPGEHTAPPRTEEGSLLGTIQYFSPERLEGKEADQRSDIFGFGTIVYEMAAGRRAFDAPSSAALIAAILTTDPPPLPPAPGTSELEWVVRRCLARNPDDRWQSMGDVEAVLKWVARTSSRGVARSTDAAPKSRVPLMVLLGCLLLAIGAAEFVRRRNDGRPPALVALTIPPPVGGTFIATQGSVESPQLAVSPDGREIAFVAAGPDSEPQIWIRTIGETAPRPLAGTEGATYPFWSPKGDGLGFFVGRELKRIDRGGGPARPIAPAQNGRGGTWAGHVIIFAPTTAGPLRRVNDDGTDLADLTTLGGAGGEEGHRFPQFLPDGRHFIWFSRNRDPAREGIYLSSLDSPERTLLVPTGTSAQYATPGRLLYVVQGTLLARNLDLTNRRLRGDPVEVATDVATSSNFYSGFSVSPGGTLAYAERDPTSDELVWVDRKGTRLVEQLPPRSRYVDFRISPDARQVAVSTVDPKTDNPDINLLDVARATGIQLIASSRTDASPVWEPAGARLVFRSNRDGNHDLYTRSSSSAGADALLLATPTGKYPTDWTASGLILYHTNAEGSWGVYRTSAGKPGAWEPLLQRREYNEMQGQISPDERWIAYTSDESSGRPEVYVQSWPDLGNKTRVSTRGALTSEWQGASDSRWHRDGRELFYVTAKGEMMSVPITVANGRVDPGAPRHLFTIAPAAIEQPYTSVYDVVPDGSKFLVRMQRDPLPISVLLNWTPP